eukprot:COSAG01_NODE_12159_length_1791_cov_1.632979_1_plen_31_part_10
MILTITHDCYDGFAGKTGGFECVNHTPDERL